MRDPPGNSHHVYLCIIYCEAVYNICTCYCKNNFFSSGNFYLRRVVAKSHPNNNYFIRILIDFMDARFIKWSRFMHLFWIDDVHPTCGCMPV